MAHVLQTRGLSKRFKKRRAVDGIDLEVEQGEVFGFLGPNGAGKSTTIRMLLSLVAPTAGEVYLFGMPLRARRRDVLARVGGFVERADFYLYLSARRNLEIVAALRGGCDRREIDRVLEIVGLRERAGDRVKTYSHGMKQRLGIAQALLGNPELVILDEPTTGLDPQGIKEVRHLIKALSAEHAMTVFLSSHLLSEIELTATSMAIINRGKLVVQGGVHALLNDGAHVVRVDAAPLDGAEAVAQRFPGVVKLERENGALTVHMRADAVAELNAALVAQGIRVRSLIPKRSLEDYFLSLTENASDID